MTFTSISNLLNTQVLLMISVFTSQTQQMLHHRLWLHVLRFSTKTILEKVDKVQYKALKLYIDAMQSTPIHYLLVECNDTPLNIRRNKLSNNFFCSQFTNFNYLLNMNITLLTTDYLSKPYWKINNQLEVCEVHNRYTQSNIKIESIYKPTCYNYSVEYSVKSMNPNFNIIPKEEHAYQVTRMSYLNNYKQKFPESILDF